jgi:hypothetical protein
MTRLCARAAVTPAITALLLVACAGGGDVSPSPDSTVAERPAAPDGWTTFETDGGNARLVVPADIDVMHVDADSISAQPPTRGGVVPFEIWVVAPGTELGEPRAGESSFEYLQQRGWLPQADEGVSFGPIVERDTMLPAGRAVEVRTSVQPGTPEEGRMVIYLIETDTGLALLRFVGTPAGMEERSRGIELMSQLVEFGH